MNDVAGTSISRMSPSLDPRERRGQHSTQETKVCVVNEAGGRGQNPHKPHDPHDHVSLAFQDAGLVDGGQVPHVGQRQYDVHVARRQGEARGETSKDAGAGAGP